ncbi:MAG: ribonuclease HII [Magnetococcales bacterium]|nr:ribonuclease HII [Magnetococcales bacterium]
MRRHLLPDFYLEEALRRSGLRLVAGVDEVGRGPLAGPVVAAAVVLDPATAPAGIDDSKKLSAEQRTLLAGQIRAWAVGIGVGLASVEEIDQLNIRRAALLAMTRAVAGMRRVVSADVGADPSRSDAPVPDLLSPDYLLVDGRDVPPGVTCPARAVVRGDALSVSIAAASILAKVTRDALMDDLARDHPGYGWERNKGYPTREHLQALERLGVAAPHRRSFAPVRRVLAADTTQ